MENAGQLDHVAAAAYSPCMRPAFPLVLVVLALPATSSPAAGPEERVRETIGAVSAVLADPRLQGSEKEAERKQAVSAVIREAFDFGEMSRATLGTHWSTLTPAQHAEFTELFGQVFESSYNRLVLRFLGEAATRYGATSTEGTRAVVRTTLDRGSKGQLPVDYHLRDRDQRWRIADVVVDGISLAGNFRAQFDKTIRSASYDELVRRLRAKRDGD
jgi:phospholipid transport system substrate-binding protein